MPAFVCVTCGVQYSPGEAPPARCPVCEDPRQWVPESGQAWTTLDELRATHVNRLADDAGLTGIGTEPKFAIGQRALLVPDGERHVLWDCITVLDDATVAAVQARGGLSAIAISHPHYYSTMVEWGRRFSCPVRLHADDAAWVMRPDPVIELWEGERRTIGDGLELLRLGGHFPGGTVLHWAAGAGGRGALLSGDIVQVIPDRGHVGFMYSYPNLIPLPVATVRAIAAALEPLAYDMIYGAWWDTIIRRDGQAIVQRSAERYARAIAGDEL